MNIAVVGTGNVGRVLGRRWVEAGHAVIFGSRTPERDDVQDLVHGIGKNACAVTPDEAAAAAGVVVLATPWGAAQSTLESIGSLKGKIIVDCTNPFKPDLSGLEVDGGTSAAERITSWAPGARVVKAFNTTGSGNMADPMYDGQPLTMFLCGDDAEAKTVVAGLASDLGFEPVDNGPLRQARYLEALAMIWISQAYRQGDGPDIGFALLKRG